MQVLCHDYGIVPGFVFTVIIKYIGMPPPFIIEIPHIHTYIDKYIIPDIKTICTDIFGTGNREIQEALMRVPSMRSTLSLYMDQRKNTIEEK